MVYARSSGMNVIKRVSGRTRKVPQLATAKMSKTAAFSASDEIIAVREKNVLHITLNRARALNALSIGMVKSINDILFGRTVPLFFSSDGDGVRCILMEGAGDRAFCAGGDVRSIYESGRNEGTPADHGAGKRGLLTSDFFREEYLMNHALSLLEYPQVSIWDGIVMGGGVGISIHGRYR